MKTTNDRTQRETSKLGTRSLALLMFFVMLFTAIGSGSLLSAFAVTKDDVTDEAAPAEAVAVEEDGYNADLYDTEETMLGVKKDSDLAGTGAATYYLYYNTSNNSTPSNMTGNSAMKQIGDKYWGEITVTTAQFYFGVSSTTEYTGSVLTSIRNVTRDSGLTNSGNTSYNANETTYYYCYASASSAGTVYVRWDGANALYVTTTKPDGYDEAGTGDEDDDDDEGGAEGIAVSDNDLLAVLRNQKVMYYVGMSTSYNTTTIYLYNCNEETVKGSNHGQTSVASHAPTVEKSLDSKTFKLYPFTYAAGTYCFGELNWAPRSAAMSAGGTYVLHNAEISAAGFTQACTYDYGDTLTFSYDAGSTKTTTTTCDSSLYMGQKLSVTSTAPGVSSLGEENVIKYYITRGASITASSNFTEYSLANGKIDTSSLMPGSYKLVSVLYDGNIYVVADTDSFTVSERTDAPSTNKAGNSIIFNLKAETEKIHLWNQTTPTGSDHEVTGCKSYTDESGVTRYLAYLEDVTASGSPGAIAYHNDLNDGNKYTGDITRGSGSGDGIYYFYSDDTPSKDVTGSWSAFTHIGTTLKINNSTDAKTMGLGDSLPVTNTPTGSLAAAATSGLAADQAKYIYYVVSPDGSATKINNTFTTNDFTFTPDEVGTYRIFAYVQDMWGYETALSSNILTITVKPTHTVVTKSNNSNLGTLSVNKRTPYEGETVTVTVNENCGDFSTISAKDATGATVALTRDAENNKVYTFTMPTSNVTVRGVFTEVAGSSNFYYNGYDNNANEMSSTNGDKYGKQMSLGKVDGETYSYYHVTDRADNQYFTVSYKDPAHTKTVFFITPEGKWDNDHGWDSGIQAQFYATDGKVISKWSWMTFDKQESDGNKVYKISVPYGARKVQFRGTKNDSNNSNYPYTAKCDLNSLSTGNKDTFYIDPTYSYTNYQYESIGLTNIGNQCPVIPEDFWEHYYDSNKYTDGFSTPGFNKVTKLHGGENHDYIQPNSLGDHASDYYVLVLYENREYTINGVKRTVTANPEVIWMDKLPGATDEEEENTIDVYAKDGAAPINWNAKTTGGASGLDGTAYNYAAIATTEITQIDGVAPEEGDVLSYNVGDASSQYQLAKIVPGSTIKITTTVDEDYKSRFYVRGFCVNGVTYYGNQTAGANSSRVNETPDTTTGAYTLTYTVPEDQTEPIEITPIYYMTSTEIGNVDMVTFYLQGFTDTIKNDKGWGNTPYVYPFYGNLNNVDNAFGCYPGQPMVYVNATYSIDVPVSNLSINEGDDDYNKTAIKGITISNGYADYVHKVKIYNWSQGSDNSDPDHMQTYDFDDFYKIYHEKTKTIDEETKHPNTITFRMKNEDDEFYAQTHGGLKKNSQRVYNKTTNISGELETIGNGWEDLTNFFDEKVDLFGTKVVDESLSTVYVVSTGYNANIAGDYGTAWMIYDNTGKLLTADTTNDRYAIPPSVLLLNYSDGSFTNQAHYPEANRSVSGAGNYTDSIAKYKSIYESLLPYAGHPVMISYEKNTQDIRDKELGTGAHRMDGRWFYTFDDDTVQANIEIEYYDASTGTYVSDADNYNTTTGATTLGTITNPCTAYFTSQGSDPSDIRHSGKERMKTGDYAFTAEGNASWSFAGWYIKYDNAYHNIVGMKTGGGSIKSEVNATIVVRFDPTNAGTLTINHTVSKGSVGSGTTSVQAVVKNAAGVVQATYTNESGKTSVMIPGDYIVNSNKDYTVTVTLTASGTLDDTVKEFGFDPFNTAKALEDPTYVPETVDGAESATATFTFTVGDLYKLGGTQQYKVLNYTSSFNQTPHYYEFTYQYPKRGSNTNDGSYTVRGTFTSDEYDTYVSGEGESRTVSEAFIKNTAPHQSNFNQELSVYLGGSTVTDNTYDSVNKKHTATVSYGQDIKRYKAIFALPYAYKSDAGTDDGSGEAYKKYTAVKSQNVDSVGTLAVKVTPQIVPINSVSYEDYFTSAENNAQTNVSKDSSNVNHTGNDFITAPDKIWNSETSKVEYFSYWQVYDYRDYIAGKENMAKVTEVYYTDFNYRAYGDYYIVPVYSDNPADSFNLKFEDVNAKSAKIMYLGDSRNQWNNPAEGTSDDWNDAADIIYNDFAVSYTYQGRELISDADKSRFTVGMFIERIKNAKGEYVKGDSSVDDMNTYKNLYSSSEAESKSKIQDYLAGTLVGKLGFAGVNVNNWTIDNTLNAKNRGEKYYYFTSQSGQTVEDHSIDYMSNSTVDDYVYRAYAYLIYDDGSTKEVTISDAAYFSMSYTANQ